MALEGFERDRLLSLCLALLDAVPKRRQAAALAGFVSLDEVVASPARAAGVLAEVERFHAQATSGAFYESFRVDSRNYMDQSAGTRRFIAEYRRLAGRVAAIAEQGAHREACAAYAWLADLHHRVDEDEEVIFLADEPGAWQIGCSWREHAPRWFRALAASRPTPAEFVAGVREAVLLLDPHHPDELLATARRAASAAQKRALSKIDLP